jgi:hypothetical protein
LCEYKTNDLAEGLNNLFEKTVEIPRIKHGNKQTVDTLINEEALLFAKYLRNERKDWNPRIPSLRAEVERKKRKELTINT